MSSKYALVVPPPIERKKKNLMLRLNFTHIHHIQQGTLTALIGNNFKWKIRM